MARLRYTLSQAKEEATRLATEYAQRQPWFSQARIKGTVPIASAPKSGSSKFPVMWSVVFVFHDPDIIMDGGELFLDVNIETKDVKPWP